jgi:hypothetical protein
MTITRPYVSAYERRVKLVADTLTRHSKLTGPAANQLAVHVLHALDHIPENMRR